MLSTRNRDKMTLIIAHSSHDAQILVADRRITNAYTGQTINDRSYKLLQYRNSAQDYVFGVAYTGLAKLGRESTTDWLMDVLPRAMPQQKEIGLAFSSFAGECSKKFSVIRGIAPSLKATTFVFCGRFNVFSPENEPPCPFVAVVSNCVDNHGRQVAAVASDFKILKWARPYFNPSKHPTTTLCRGDLLSASKHGTTFKKVIRQMRTDISPESKVRLAVQYVKLVAESSITVGLDVLSLCLYANGESSGGEYPKWKHQITRTMPHLVMADGARMANFQVTCKDGFIDT